MSGISSRQGKHQVAQTLTMTARAPGARTARRTSAAVAGTTPPPGAGVAADSASAATATAANSAMPRVDPWMTLMRLPTRRAEFGLSSPGDLVLDADGGGNRRQGAARKGDA